MNPQKGIVWFRQDLRLHDNEALTEALKHCESIIPVYVFDERIFMGKTGFGFEKTGKFRANFVIESVKDLRNSLRKLGTDLIVRVGKPEEEIFKIARKCQTNRVFCNHERTREEMEVQDALEKKLWSIGQEIRFTRGKMLYYTADLPFPVAHTPDTFAHFRKEVERFVEIRNPFPSPMVINFEFPETLERGDIPNLRDFGHESFEKDQRSSFVFNGGETEALKRLQLYFHDSDLAKDYKESKHELFGADISTKFSPWLAQGCLSPKLVYRELNNYESRNGKNKSTLELFHSIMYRDFLRFMGKKHGDKIFHNGGIAGKPNPDLRNDRQLFKIWKNGRTGVPLIDANIRELNLTGYLSNRGRQNVASFLIHDLKVNWQMGAEFFESMLLDYDPCSNWVNWNFMAGLGKDQRDEWHFNILSQAKRHDPHGDYVRLWIPELSHLPSDKIHRPDALSSEEQESLKIKLGADYPKTMVSMNKWA